MTLAATPLPPGEQADRVERAVGECMAVEYDAPGMFRVTTLDGDDYVVDLLAGRCTCPDARYNLLGTTGWCKHALHAAFMTGLVPV